jgi:hypothetical protein
MLLSQTLVACNQDSASSNEGRDTHMGDIRAVGQSAAGSVPESGPPAAAVPSPGASQAGATPEIAPAASAAPSASASARPAEDAGKKTP